MSYNIKITANFDKEAKPLIKKYPSFKSDIARLISDLETNPTLGIPLGRNLFKIRIAISSKGKGKSGGARIITYVVSKMKQSILFQFMIRRNTIRRILIRCLVY